MKYGIGSSRSRARENGTAAEDDTLRVEVLNFVGDQFITDARRYRIKGESELKTMQEVEEAVERRTREADRKLGVWLAGWPGTAVVVADHGHTLGGGHGGDEPDVVTTWMVAAGPGVSPGEIQGVHSALAVAPATAAAPGPNSLATGLVDSPAFQDAGDSVRVPWLSGGSPRATAGFRAAAARALRRLPANRGRRGGSGRIVRARIAVTQRAHAHSDDARDAMARSPRKRS